MVADPERAALASRTLTQAFRAGGLLVALSSDQGLEPSPFLLRTLGEVFCLLTPTRPIGVCGPWEYLS